MIFKLVEEDIVLSNIDIDIIYVRIEVFLLIGDILIKNLCYEGENQRPLRGINDISISINNKRFSIDHFNFIKY